MVQPETIHVLLNAVGNFTLSKAFFVSLFPLLKQYIQRRRFSVDKTMWAGSFKACGNSNASGGCSLVNFRFRDENMFINDSARMTLKWNELILTFTFFL